MKRYPFILVVLILLNFIKVTQADHQDITLDQLIVSSDIIAVVTIDKPNKECINKQPKPQHFSYATPAKSLSSIKKYAGESLLIFHGSSFEDQLFENGIGDYLVFLKWKRDKWIPTDAGNSSKYIKQGKVSGWSSSHRPEAVEQLQTAIEYIKTKG